MARSIDTYVSRIHELESKRDELRLRVATEDLGDNERGQLDGEIAVATADLERYARYLNEELRECARKGYAPEPPRKLDDVKDPDLRAFCNQVKETLVRIRELKADKDKRLADERVKLGREKQKADQLQRDGKTRRRDLDGEGEKLSRARAELDKDRKHLEAEKAKAAREREHLAQNKAKAASERTQLQRRIDEGAEERKRIDQERKDLARRLREARDARRRGELEQKGRELGPRAAQLDQQLKRDRQALEQRLGLYERNLDRELEQLDEADERFTKELKRLDSEAKKLDEQEHKLAAVKKSEDERMSSIEQVQAQLAKEPG